MEFVSRDRGRDGCYHEAKAVSYKCTFIRSKLAGIFHLFIQRASTCSSISEKGLRLLRFENVRMICCFFEPLLHEVND